MLKNYSTTQEFMEDYVSGNVLTPVILEDKMEINLSPKFIPYLMLTHNCNPITTVDRLIECVTAITTLNPKLSLSDITYNYVTSDNSNHCEDNLCYVESNNLCDDVVPVNSASPKPLPVDEEEDYISSHIMKDNESDYSVNYGCICRYGNPERAKTDWYKDVLQGKIFYEDALLNNRKVLRKQRVRMFVNHMFYGKTPLISYIYGYLAPNYYLEKRKDVITKAYNNYLENNLQDNVNKYMHSYCEGDTVSESLLRERLASSMQQRLDYKYNIDTEYINQGIEMLCQLYNPDVTIDHITLEEVLHSVIELVKEYCSYTKYANAEEILTVIFARDFFARSELPKDKWQLFSTEVFKTTYSSIDKLPTIRELYNAFDEDELSSTHSFAVIKSSIYNYLKLSQCSPTKNTTLMYILNVKKYMNKLHSIVKSKYFIYTPHMQLNLFDILTRFAPNIYNEYKAISNHSLSPTQNDCSETFNEGRYCEQDPYYKDLKYRSFTENIISVNDAVNKLTDYIAYAKHLNNLLNNHIGIEYIQREDWIDLTNNIRNAFKSLDTMLDKGFNLQLTEEERDNLEIVRLNKLITNIYNKAQQIVSDLTENDSLING